MFIFRLTSANKRTHFIKVIQLTILFFVSTLLDSLKKNFFFQFFLWVLHLIKTAIGHRNILHKRMNVVFGWIFQVLDGAKSVQTFCLIAIRIKGSVHHSHHFWFYCSKRERCASKCLLLVSAVKILLFTKRFQIFLSVLQLVTRLVKFF